MFTKSQTLSKSSYKTGDFGKLLGITNQSVIRYCNRGKLSCYKTEYGHHRILGKDVDIAVSDKTDNKFQLEELTDDIIGLIHSFSGDWNSLRHKIKSEIDCYEETS